MSGLSVRFGEGIGLGKSDGSVESGPGAWESFVLGSIGLRRKGDVSESCEQSYLVDALGDGY